LSVDTALDHLIVGASSLADGVDYVAKVTGATPRRGGRHVAMGTHNALLRLGDRVYLEVLAIQAELAEHPRLIAWVARTNDIDGAVARCPIALGAVHPFERGAYRWRITMPDDGKRPATGLLPALIQWDVAAHPADALPQSGVSIAGIAGAHPDPATIRAALAALGLAEALSLSRDRHTRLTATLMTPRGTVSL